SSSRVPVGRSLPQLRVQSPACAHRMHRLQPCASQHLRQRNLVIWWKQDWLRQMLQTHDRRQSRNRLSPQSCAPLTCHSKTERELIPPHWLTRLECHFLEILATEAAANLRGPAQGWQFPAGLL